MILVDTDVILDVALGREPHVDASARLLDLIERAGRGAVLAWRTVANLNDQIRPARSDVETRSFLLELTRLVTVAPTDSDTFRYAAPMEMSDPEVAMQVAAARACGVMTSVTRNVRGFRQAPIEVRTPAELLKRPSPPYPSSRRISIPCTASSSMYAWAGMASSGVWTPFNSTRPSACIRDVTARE